MGASRAELQVSFSWPHRVPDRHYHRGTLEASQSNFHLLAEGAGQRLHRELVLRFLREISPRPKRAFQHAVKPRNAVATGSPRAWAATKVPSCGPDPAIAARAANRRAVLPQKAGPEGGEN